MGYLWMGSEWVVEGWGGVFFFCVIWWVKLFEVVVFGD